MRAYQYRASRRMGRGWPLDVRDQENDIWIWDIARETPTRLTFFDTRPYNHVLWETSAELREKLANRTRVTVTQPTQAS